jgi:hypothetical protein
LFANGGAQAYVARVPHTGTVGASVSFTNLIFTARSSGTWANGNLLVGVDYVGVDQSASTGEPTAFNLTITNLEENAVETFPSVLHNFNKNSYVLPVVNDPDTGSQLVNVALVAPGAGGVPGHRIDADVRFLQAHSNKQAQEGVKC